jgi:hypothetical protein
MGTELSTKGMLEQTLVLLQMTFLNNVRKVGRLVLPRTSCCISSYCLFTSAMYYFSYFHAQATLFSFQTD